jgi:ATP-dependent Zn protease
MATKKSTRPDPLRGTAIHEAGHAVASFYLHVKIKQVTIIPAERSLGHMRHAPIRFARQGEPYEFDDSEKGIARTERRIILLWAGPLAERRFAPRSRWRVGAGSDFDVMVELFGQIQGEDDEAAKLYGRLLRRRAEILVELRWKDIVAVADALLEHKTLDAEGVRAAIHRAHGVEPLSFERGVRGG